MSEEIQHVEKLCEIIGCANSATQWIETDLIRSWFDNGRPVTFYFCSEHTEIVDEDGTSITFLNPLTGDIVTVEIGAYACNQECEECNQ